MKTKALTSLFGFVVGDIMAQRIEGGNAINVVRYACHPASPPALPTHEHRSRHRNPSFCACHCLALLQPLTADGLCGCCRRSLRLGAYGLSIDGPIGHLWYKLLDKYVYPKDPQCTAAVLLKTAADQVVWAPVMTCVYFAFLRLAEGHPEMIMDTIQVCPLFCTC